MARKRNNNARPKNADSDPTSQPRGRQSLRPRSQQPKPQRAKNTASGQRHQGQDKTTDIPVVKITLGFDKASKLTSGQTRTSQKGPNKHQANMTRRGRRTNGPAQHPAPGPQAQLELPDWTSPKNQSKNARRKNRGGGAGKPGAKPEDLPPPKPWEMDDIFPEPVGNPCTFNYARIWRSLENVEGGVNQAIQTYLARGRQMQLPRVFPDSSLPKGSEVLKEVEDKYWKACQPELLKIRRNNLNAPSAKLFIAVRYLHDPISAGYNELTPSQSSNHPFFKAMRVAEIRHQITGLLLPSMGDITALATTCKGAAVQMRNAFDYWDFRPAVLDTDKLVEERDANGEEQKLSDEERQEQKAIKRLVRAKGDSAVPLVISPISNEPEDPENPYEADFRNLRRICRAITEVPSSFRTVIIDRIPFFNVALFEMMVNSMPNLETVIITRCPLLDVTKLKPLLDVIERHPRPGPANAPEKYIRLDFGPFFFEGPNSCNRLGSYGVTWHEPTFNIPKAVFALILLCWDLSRKVGMDLVSESSSFWSFVRGLPGPDVLWAMKAREALITRNHELSVRTKSEQTIKTDFADDLAAALIGDNKPHPQRPARMAARLPPRNKTYWRDYIKCGSCKSTYPAGVFPLRDDCCWGCKMTQFVETMEDSHMRFWQVAVMAHWLHGFDSVSTNLEELLFSERSNLGHTVPQVQLMDWTWKYWRNFRPRTVDGWAVEQFCPPLPGLIKNTVAALTRWRFKRHPVAEPFDYRKGGPQHEHPCKVPLCVSELDESSGAESLKNFARRWQWTSKADKFYTENLMANDRSVRHLRGNVGKALEKARENKSMRDACVAAEWHEQNKLDKEVHRWTQPRIEDCLYALGTPDKRPFNLDKPALDPVRDAEEYKKVVEAEIFRSAPYTFTSAVNTGW
ncbi:hypothetical protein C8A03DRAFT_12858 [Achaetomium macrosporum]|uniref:Uncharacterized protein n=1 Tax=Achaetomium macrosporum TaxID=79813 RepID=A0AAN7HHM3_9PEZI|nr:hypothetical protein C8A03DRAFT_12858 [Achaetomium macrosporum]